MKKLIIALAFILFAGVAFGQTLQKGSVLALRTDAPTLNPGVTMEQYTDFMIDKFAPEMEKIFPGTKVFVLKGDRGEHKGGFAMLIFVESAEVRDKIFGAEDADIQSKLLPLMEELGKYGTVSDNYTDWVIQ
ncbi:MAG: hypothetical protein U9R49_03375 [Bacteroidota bacterium]|nr:hypothetical protein [Bacteroidota bacterium]